MIRRFTCIICPNGCDIQAEVNDNGRVTAMTGSACAKGADYVTQELTAPERTIASSVTLKHGELPLVSVRLDSPVPKNRLMDVMAEIRSVTLEAPVAIGDVAIANVLGLKCNVIVTKNVNRV